MSTNTNNILDDLKSSFDDDDNKIRELMSQIPDINNIEPIFSRYRSKSEFYNLDYSFSNSDN